MSRAISERERCVKERLQMGVQLGKEVGGENKTDNVCGLSEMWFCVCVFSFACLCVLEHILQLRHIHTTLVQQTWTPMMLFDWPSGPKGPSAHLSPLHLPQIALTCPITRRVSNPWGGAYVCVCGKSLEKSEAGKPQGIQLLLA